MKLLLLIPLLLTGCANLTPEQNDRLFNAGLNLGKSVIRTQLPDRPDTKQKYDPREGYNFGTGK